MSDIGIQLVDVNGNKISTSTFITKIRPRIDESIMVLEERYRILDITTNTSRFVQDLLILTVKRIK